MTETQPFRERNTMKLCPRRGELHHIGPPWADQRRHSMADRMVPDPKGDGIDRRGFLKCMAWAGTGLLCTINGGILTSLGLTEAAEARGKAAAGGLSFAQISDSHLGFNKAANKDVIGT